MLKKKIVWIVVAVLAIVLVAGLAVRAKIMQEIEAYQNDVAGIQIEEIDLSGAADGTYEGSYDTAFIKVTVEVDIRDHQITDIRLTRHENGTGTPAEAVIPEVLESQSLEVDMISGATNSSKLILKAIELAVAKAT